MKAKNIVIEIICYLLIALFVYAAVSKLADLQKFKVQIGQSPLLTRYARWIIYVVPVIEILIVGLLALPHLRRPGLYASFTLMTVFTLYILALLTYSSHVPCSCGGILQKMSWNTHIWFNTGFILLAMIGVFLLESRGKYFVAIKKGETENL